MSPASHKKTPIVKLPQLNSEMNSQQFRKFRIDWDVFTKMTSLLLTQTDIQLYNNTDKTLQNSIINTYFEFFNSNSGKLYEKLEVLVTQKLNIIVHRISFSFILQSKNESIQNYLIQEHGIAASYASTVILIYPVYTSRINSFGV